MSFADFALHPTLLRGVADLGFEVPTPIQRAAIPPALEGRDVLACAMTGSGKTAAFMLPILQRFLVEKKRATRALILTPTRELAAQIEDHTRGLGRYAGIGVASVIGGVSAGPQEQALRRGVEIIVATPGRLLDHLRSGIAKFDQLEVLVLDEADRMLDMGFIPDVRRILGYLPKKRQTFFFSATLPAPVVQLSRDMLVSPVAIDIERPSAPATGITHAVYPVAGEMKSALLVALLKKDGAPERARVHAHEASREPPHGIARASGHLLRAHPRQPFAGAAHRRDGRLQGGEVPRARGHGHCRPRHRRDRVEPRRELSTCRTCPTTTSTGWAARRARN